MTGILLTLVCGVSMPSVAAEAKGGWRREGGSMSGGTNDIERPSSVVSHIFMRMGSFIERWPALSLGLAILLLVAAIFGMQRLVFASGLETLVSTDSELYQSFQRYSEDFGGDPVIVVISSDGLDHIVQRANLEAMAELSRQLDGRDYVFSVTSPLSVMMEAVPPGSISPGSIPSPEQVKMMLLDPTTGKIRAQFTSVFPEPTEALVFVNLRGNMSGEEMGAAAEDVRMLVDSLPFADVEVDIAGSPVLVDQINEMLYSALFRTLILSVVLMLVVLAVVFGVRGVFLWRWLALGVMMVALIYAFGAMGWLNIPLTMATTTIFPILVGLGIDYGIQLHNRFDEEARRGVARYQAITTSMAFMGPAIGVALLASVCGVSALFFSPLPLIKDFAKMLIIGLAIAYVTALFLVPTFLRLRPVNSNKTVGNASQGDGHMEPGLRKVTAWVVSKPWLVVPLAMVPVVFGVLVDSRIGIETDQSKWLREDVPIVQTVKQLETLVGGAFTINILVEGDISSPGTLRWMQEVGADIRASYPDEVSRLSSLALLMELEMGGIPPSPQAVRRAVEQMPPSVRSALVNPSLDAANFTVVAKFMPLERMKELQDHIDDLISRHPPGVTAIQTGWSVVETNTWLALGRGRQQMTLWSIGFVFLALLVLLRARVVKAILATLPMVLVVAWSALVMYLAGMSFNPLTATMGALVLGIGAEYSILVMWRYEEERARGRRPAEAMAEGVSRLGRAILASGLTTIAGFGALLYARDFIIMRDFSIIIMLDVFLALVATLVVLPALVVGVDRLRDGLRGRSAARMSS
jgi:hypothetical protein